MNRKVASIEFLLAAAIAVGCTAPGTPAPTAATASSASVAPTANVAIPAGLFVVADENSDGELSSKELDAALDKKYDALTGTKPDRETYRAAVRSQLNKYDANHDGTFSEAERRKIPK